MPVRIGAVSYLNTKPLIHGLTQQIDCQLTLDLPGRLADQLMEGHLDIALIPSVEYLRNSSLLAIVSDACIACRGAVRSVQLLFRKPPAEVRTLALDEGSRTSAVLAQVLLAERFNIRPFKMSLPIADDFETCPADAVLVIGDRAMNIDPRTYVQCWDLGEQWTRWAKLPFVFAMWVSRRVDLQRPEIVDAIEALELCRDSGIVQLKSIAEQQAAHYRLTVDDCLTYFKDQLHFFLENEERSGLEQFRILADHLGLLACENSFEGQTSSREMASSSIQH